MLLKINALTFTAISDLIFIVSVENRPLEKVIRNYIRDSSGVFSISSLVRMSMMLFPAFALMFVEKYSCIEIL